MGPLEQLLDGARIGRGGRRWRRDRAPAPSAAARRAVGVGRQDRRPDRRPGSRPAASCREARRPRTSAPRAPPVSPTRAMSALATTCGRWLIAPPADRARRRCHRAAPARRPAPRTKPVASATASGDACAVRRNQGRPSNSVARAPRRPGRRAPGHGMPADEVRQAGRRAASTMRRFVLPVSVTSRAAGASAGSDGRSARMASTGAASTTIGRVGERARGRRPDRG